MTSIIIPAHNEEKSIGKCLQALLPGVLAGEYEVLVVCNGCTDGTARVVTGFGPAIRCLETPVASKTNALNIGDELASGYPRIYLDADVVLAHEAVRKIINVLAEGRYPAASPKMKMDFDRSSWAVRAYYEVWQGLPYVEEGMIGTGVYALSEAGRKRYGKFPSIIADDGYVRALFTTQERVRVDTCYSLVAAPTNIASLLRINKRVRLGRYELQEKFPSLITSEIKDYKAAAIKYVMNYHLWPKLLVYISVNILARALAQFHRFKMGYVGWARDETSRNKKVLS